MFINSHRLKLSIFRAYVVIIHFFNLNIGAIYFETFRIMHSFTNSRLTDLNRLQRIFSL